MSERFLRVTNAFTAQGDDGKEYKLRVLTEFLGVTGEGKQKRSVLGSSFLRTEDDREVVRLDKGRYSIPSMGVVVTTDAVDAP
jgi:hypothetical protein